MPILQLETNEYPSNLCDDLPCRSPDRDWWAVCTKPRQEKSLARDLLRGEVPFYLPLVKTTKLIRNRRVTSFLPLFQGYLFIYGDDDERSRTAFTNRAALILKVEDGDELRRDLQAVQRLLESDAALTVERRLKSGDQVRVKHGSLAGLEGTILQRRKTTRLLISVKYLQQGVSVEIDDFMLERI